MFARALFMHDKTKAKSLAASTDNESSLGYTADSNVRWRTHPEHDMALQLVNQEGETVGYIRECMVVCGGFLTPTAYAAGLYLKECIAEGKMP